MPGPEVTVTYLAIFLGGIAGSLHCVGMCGAFPLALGGGGAQNRLLRQLLYNLGRLHTLVFIGAVSGAAGAALVGIAPVRAVEQALAVLAGTIMIVVGLEVLGVLAQLSNRAVALVQATVGRLLGGVMRSRSLAAPLALGVFNAFLPCQLIYAFAAYAAGTASISAGMLTMLAFGLGTMPAMLALGLARVLARPALRARLSLMSGVVVIVFGVVTLLRGFDVLPHRHHHTPHAHAAVR
jgi:sulfite exporter TauE/SafE